MRKNHNLIYFPDIKSVKKFNIPFLNPKTIDICLDKIKFYKLLSRILLVKTIFKKKIGRSLSELEEQGILVDSSMVTPNDFQTALAGEPGNYFKKSLGDPRRTSIRHIEEAYSAFGRANARESGGVERQQRTLIDTSNIVLDEIINGSRDCLLIATTDQNFWPMKSKLNLA